MSLALGDLVQAARASTARHRAQVPEVYLRAEAEGLASAAAHSDRLRRALATAGMSVIAEIKGASPLSGPLREHFDPVELAEAYAANGAAAISVLTEERFFAGGIDHLEAVSRAVSLPTLRKDFIVEPYQIYHAATAGASAVLLIAELLEGSHLREMVEVAHSVGLDALVEMHRPERLDAAIGAGSGLIGINNRDLGTMEIDVSRSLQLVGDLPGDWVRVSESGIEDATVVGELKEAGFDAILVGTALVQAEDPGGALRELAGALREMGAE